MKTASVQHINNVIQPKVYTSYDIQFSTLINVYDAIMRKLTNVSPFILLLVPVFVMMLLSLKPMEKNTDADIAQISKVSAVSRTIDATLK